MNMNDHSVKCPNCRREFLLEGVACELRTMETSFVADEKTSKMLHLLGQPFPCPSRPVMIKAGKRYRSLAVSRFFLVLFGIILAIIGVLMPLEDPPQIGWVVKGMLLAPTVLCISKGISASRLMRHANRWEVASMRRTCQHCGAAVDLDDAEFCSTCGTKLLLAVMRITTCEDQIEIRNSIRKTRTVAPLGTCLVCNLEMNPFENLASCPRCGNFFHRAHLIKWVQMEKRCPVCNERLVDSEIIITFNE